MGFAIAKRRKMGGLKRKQTGRQKNPEGIKKPLE